MKTLGDTLINDFVKQKKHSTAILSLVFVLACLFGGSHMASAALPKVPNVKISSDGILTWNAVSGEVAYWVDYGSSYMDYNCSEPENVDVKALIDNAIMEGYLEKRSSYTIKVYAADRSTGNQVTEKTEVLFSYSSSATVPALLEPEISDDGYISWEADESVSKYELGVDGHYTVVENTQHQDLIMLIETVVRSGEVANTGNHEVSVMGLSTNSVPIGTPWTGSYYYKVGIAISSVKVAKAPADQIYTGKELKPGVKLSYNGKVLTEGTDYQLSYTNNIEVGTGEVSVLGLGDYSGRTSLPFSINAPSASTSKEDDSKAGGDGTENAASGGSEAALKYPAGIASPEKPSTVKKTEKLISALQNDKNSENASFSQLFVKGTAKSKTSIKLTWKAVKNATGYIVYGNKSGKTKYEKLATVTGRTYTQKKRKAGTYYKYIVAAVKGSKVLAVSKTIHVATTGGKYGNYTAVTISKSGKTIRKISVKAGKKVSIKGTLKTGALKVKRFRKIAFESSDARIATVSSTGKVTGVKKGSCYIYAYAQNGVYAKVKVTVKAAS